MGLDPAQHLLAPKYYVFASQGRVCGVCGPIFEENWPLTKWLKVFQNGDNCRKVVKAGGQVMFLGTYYPKLIGKRRIALPKKIRKELKSKKIVLTIGFEKCIFGFNEKDWEEIVKPELSRPLFSDVEGRSLRRKMCMEAMVIELGAQGRFVIPKAMMKYAGVKDKLTLIGAGDHFEIWDSQEWDLYRRQWEKKKH